MQKIQTLIAAILGNKKLLNIDIDYTKLNFGHSQLTQIILGYYTDFFYLDEELTERDYIYIKNTKELDFNILNNWQKEIEQIGTYSNLIFWEHNNNFWNSDIDITLIKQAIGIIDNMQNPDYDRVVINNFTKNYKKSNNYNVTDFVVFTIINDAYLNKNINWVEISNIKNKIKL